MIFEFKVNFLPLAVIFIASILLNLSLIKFPYLPKKINNIQDIHHSNTPRLGGLVIFSLFFVYEILYIGSFDILTWFFLFMILIPALAEDLNKSIHPYIRLFLMLVGCLFIVNSLPLLPLFNFGDLNIIFNNQMFQLIFFSLALTIIINGQNMIDGVNGLSGITSLTIFICILILTVYVNEIKYVNLIFIIISLIISFLIFNYPFGKIFLGDLGSYFLGFLSGYLIINLFAQNSELPSWLAVIILFYPAFEVLFSYIRKLIKKKSPFFPDQQHLHTQIYFYLKKYFSNLRSNALVAPTLIILWLSPLLFLLIILQYPALILVSFFLLIGIYFIYYLIFK